MAKRLILLFAILFLAACAPKENPALVGKINDYFANTGSKSYDGSGKYNPMPYAVGQYVVHGQTNNGKRSVSKTAIVGKEQGGWIIETHSIDPASEGKMQMLVVGLDAIQAGKDFDNLDILWVKIQSADGQIQTIDGQMLAMAEGMYKKHLNAFNVNATANWQPGEDVAVPAGTFRNAVSTDTEVSVMGMKFRSTAWFHEKVPVNGMVKSVSDDSKSTSVLLEFGYSGARPGF